MARAQLALGKGLGTPLGHYRDVDISRDVPPYDQKVSPYSSLISRHPLGLRSVPRSLRAEGARRLIPVHPEDGLRDHFICVGLGRERGMSTHVHSNAGRQPSDGSRDVKFVQATVHGVDFFPLATLSDAMSAVSLKLTLPLPPTTCSGRMRWRVVCSPCQNGGARIPSGSSACPQSVEDAFSHHDRHNAPEIPA